MFVQPYDRPATDALFPDALDTAPGFNFGTGFSSTLAQRPSNDLIYRLQPPSPNNGFSGAGYPGSSTGSMARSLIGVIEQLLQTLAQLIPGASALGGLFGNNEQYFQSAQGSSVGDPHLSFNGNTWDNMNAQPDLLHSDSFPGGYQLSTQVTPTQNGVTRNQSATITTNYGMTSVSMDNAGNPTILQNGMPVSINAGQTIDLGNGQTVTRTQNGLQVTATNGMGAEITTTMTPNDGGVDVQTTANNADLGGTLVNGQSAPVTIPRMRTFAVP